MTNATILWADDEIDLLRPHILYLEEKGYEVVPVTSGGDALDELQQRQADLVFLDEQMPGLSGLDTLKAIKERWPQLPVVMITKSEEEHIMEDALGGKISDYLIKPVSPSQLLLTVKKHTERRRLQSEHSTMGYQQQFREIGMQLGDCRTAEAWVEMYRKLVYWDLELARVDDENIHDIFLTQRREANAQYGRFFEEHYLDWISGREEKPLMSHTVLQERLMPLLKTAGSGERGVDRTRSEANYPQSTFLIVIDNFRYDQWRFVQPLVEPYYRVEREELYYTILPTTTQFARNAMFAGLMPSEIERKYPQYWVNEDEEGYKNQYEDELLEENLRRHGLNIKHTYNKVLNAQYGRRLVERVPELMRSPLNVVIYNFVDMLSHSTTDSDVVRQLADSDSAYRSLTRSWMEHSPLMELLQALAERKVRVIITTDHGSTRVERPVRVKGDRGVSVNLRYKQGRLLDYNPREVFEVKEPARLFLPRRHISSPYIFARAGDFFAYPNNYNQYVQLYTSTLQHGGISLEETLVPFVTLEPR